MPLVRVVIPTYNRSALVAEALESLLAQSFSDFEVVVADDGSTDDTQNVLRHFAARDRRVRSLALPHGGAASARNAAIAEPGQHRYVAFLDSDDLWVSDHLETAVGTLEREPTVGVFFGWYERLNLTGSSAELTIQGAPSVRKPRACATRSLGSKLYLLEASDSRLALLRSEFALHPSTVVVRCNAVKRAQWFDINLEIYEDAEFFLSLAADGCNFVYHDAIHYCKRHFGDNLTGSTDLSSPVVRRRYQSVANYHKFKRSICKGADELQFVSHELAHAFFIIGECSREQSDLRAARAAYGESLKYRPTYRALRGLCVSSLPSEVYSLLRLLKSAGKQRVPQ